MARILVVEDDSDVRELVARRLHGAGHRVKTAGDGAEASRVVAVSGAPEVVVLDVKLPDTSGFELLQNLRTQASKTDLNAIFLSGCMSPLDIETGRALGAIYLTKPFVGGALIGAIDALLLAEAQRLSAPEDW